MKTITLNDKQRVLSEHNSKGNQLKWKFNNKWYKADYLGYESLSEYICSNLLEYTNVDDFIHYDLQKIQYKSHIFNGCVSENFLTDEYNIITLDKLFQAYYNLDITMKCVEFYKIEDRIKFVVNKVIEATRLDNFGEYLTLLLEMDALFLNEDRHFNNIAVLQNKETGLFEYCPIFDNGASLLSDTSLDYPIEKSLNECFEEIESKPFAYRFEEQIDAAEHLYKVQFQYNFTMTNVKNLAYKAKETGMYSDEIIERIILVLREQVKKCAYYKQSNYMNLPKKEFKNITNNYNIER